MSLTSFAVSLAAPLPRLDSFSRYLFIGPHPDDIEIGAGATAAKLAAMGKELCFLICTDGRYGDGNSAGITGDKLAKARKLEAVLSASRLGVSDVRFLDFPDGGFYSVDDLTGAIAAIIGDFKPDMILAPDPDITSESHPDHLLAGRAAKKLACLAPYPGIMEHYGVPPVPVQAIGYFMTCRANVFYNTTGYLPVQLDALFSCHKTQYPYGCSDAQALRLYLRIRAADFGLRSFCKTAEGFRMLTALRMHCLPEADLL